MRMIHLTSVAQIEAMARRCAAISTAPSRRTGRDEGAQAPEHDLVYPRNSSPGWTKTDLRAAFDALTPGRRRAYNLFFTAPSNRKPARRGSRNCARILDGKGLDDR